MKIRELFQKDLFRPINGVVKADQLDPLSVWQELDEYVVTKELDRHLRGFFSSYLSPLLPVTRSVFFSDSAESIVSSTALASSCNVLTVLILP